MSGAISGLGSVLRRAAAKPVGTRSLGERAALSGLLSGGEQAIILVLRFGTTLIATRLLSPEIFGLFALVLTFQTVLVMVTDFGIRPLILTAEGVPSAAFLRTCWTVQVLRGAALWGAVLVLAAGISGLQTSGVFSADASYGAADLPIALAVSGLLLVFQGGESVNQHMASRALDLGRITALNLLHAGLSAGLTVAIAWHWPSIWALVIAGIAAGAIRMVLTHVIFSGPGMWPAWDHPTRLLIRARGKWIMGHSALTVLVSEGDRILLGAVLPAPLFGAYYLAKQIALIPLQFIGKIHASIALQVFGALAEQGAAEFREKFYRYRLPLDSLACVFAGGFLTAGPAMVGLIYDPRYAAAGGMLQWLALALPLIGPGLMREAFLAERAFRFATCVNLVQAGTLWVLLGGVLLWSESIELALLAIALHRVPELWVLCRAAQARGWLNPRRELIGLPFLLFGALAGLFLDTVLAAS